MAEVFEPLAPAFIAPEPVSAPLLMPDASPVAPVALVPLVPPAPIDPDEFIEPEELDPLVAPIELPLEDPVAPPLDEPEVWATAIPPSARAPITPAMVMAFMAESSC